MQNTIEIGSGDNTTTSTSSQPELQHAPVNRVTMKPPPFYRTNPTVWFRQISWNYQRHHQISPHPRSNSGRRRNQPANGN